MRQYFFCTCYSCVMWGPWDSCRGLQRRKSFYLQVWSVFLLPSILPTCGLLQESMSRRCFMEWNPTLLHWCVMPMWRCQSRLHNGNDFRLVANMLFMFADPAYNACKDPGTPAYGIPLQAQGLEVISNYYFTITNITVIYNSEFQ